MRKRRKSIAPKLFFIAGVVLLLISAVIALPSLVRLGWIGPEWQERVDILLREAQRLVPSDEQIGFLKWLGGLALTAVGAASALFVSWHFAEINLPQRIQDLKKAHLRNHLSLQPQFLALSRRGLGTIPADIETSRLTLLRKWLSGWSRKEQARVLAASANQLAREASALSAAAQEAQQEQITAHLIRGCQHASESDDEKALEEFEAATRVRADDILSRDIAAGCARRLKKQKRELELLREMQLGASNAGLDIDHARALRRRAELLDKHDNEPDRVEARNHLNEARGLLQPLVGHKEVNLELGRVLTLFCEVQFNRTVIGRLGGQDGPVARMRNYMNQVAMHTRPEEQGGEAYGEERALRIERRVAGLRGDVVAEGDDSDTQ